MRRRDLVKVIAGAAVWPIAAHAQQPEKMRRIGVLSSLAETDPEAHAWDDAFRSRLIELQWIDGRNVHIDYRWGAGDVDRMRQFAPELVRLNPDVLVGISTPATAALQAATRTIPIVFAWVSDPVGSGFVSSLANPGGNITGFLNIESSVIGKWLALMHEIAPKSPASDSCSIHRQRPMLDIIWIRSDPPRRRLRFKRSTPPFSASTKSKPLCRNSVAKLAPASSSCRTLR